MIYVIGGTYDAACDYCWQTLQIHPKDRTRVRCMSIFSVAMNGKLRGVQLKKGDKIITVAWEIYRNWDHKSMARQEINILERTRRE